MLKMVIRLCPAGFAEWWPTQKPHPEHHSKEPRHLPHTSLRAFYAASFLVLLLLKTATPS